MQDLATLSEQLPNELKDYVIEEPAAPKVSVVIPCYNVQDYIVKCLNSIIKQTLKEIEIICVNDGSTDLTPEILKIYENIDKRVKVISQENQKLGASRNNGFAQANGEYIGFIDSDDWIDLDYYEKLYNAAKKYDSDIAVADCLRVGNGKTKKRLNLKKEELWTTAEHRLTGCKQASHPSATNKIYRTSFLKQQGLTFPTGVICEDKIYTCKAVYYANSVVSVPNTYYYYYRRPNSIVHTKNNAYDSEKLMANHQVLEFLKENNVKLKKNDFWAVKKDYKKFGIHWYRIKESLQTEKHLLFGFIPVMTKKT